MASKVYYDTSGNRTLWSTPTWTEATNWIKLRVIDSLDSPRFVEFWVSDPNNVIQNAGTYTPYQRVRVVFDRNNTIATIFVGRIEYIEPKFDEGYGQILVIQAKDALQELQNRKLNYDFSPLAAAKNKLVCRIIQYSVYAELSYTNRAGGSFTVNSAYYLSINCGVGDTAICRIVYDSPSGITGTLAVDHVAHSNLANQMTAGDVITEYTGGGVATGVTAQVNVLSMNIDTSTLSAAPNTQATTNLGRYLGSSYNALDASREISFSDYDAGSGTYCYDFYLDNANPPAFAYFLRGSRDSTIDFSYGVVESASVRPMLANYEFPVAVKEGVTHIVGLGLDSNTRVQRVERFSPGAGTAGSVAYVYKTFKDWIVQQRAQGSVADITNMVLAEENKLDSTVIQRGKIQIVGYPINYTTADVARSGQYSTINIPSLAGINGTNMIIVSIDYEEPPGIATIELIGSKGKAEKSWGFLEDWAEMHKQDDRNAWNVYGMQQQPTSASWTDEQGNIHVEGQAIFLYSSGDANPSGIIYAYADGSYRVVCIDAQLLAGDVCGINDHVWTPQIGPFADAAGYTYFKTTNKARDAYINHVFAPVTDGVNAQGRLGDATHKWLSAHVDTITTSSVLGTAMKYGSSSTDAAGDAVVTHGVGAVPSSVIIQSIGAGGDYSTSVDTVGAVNFSAHIRQVPSNTGNEALHTHAVSITSGAPSETTSVSQGTHIHTIANTGVPSTTSTIPSIGHTHGVSGTSGTPSEITSVSQGTHIHTIANTGASSENTSVSQGTHVHTVANTGVPSTTSTIPSIGHTHDVSGTSGVPSEVTSVSQGTHVHTVANTGVPSTTSTIPSIGHTHTLSGQTDNAAPADPHLHTITSQTTSAPTGSLTVGSNTHTHTVPDTAASLSVVSVATSAHTHAVSITTSAPTGSLAVGSSTHTHTVPDTTASLSVVSVATSAHVHVVPNTAASLSVVNVATSAHTHAISITTSAPTGSLTVGSATHTHTVPDTTASLSVANVATSAHVHTVSGTSAGGSSHNHTVLTAPGVVSFYWVAFK